MKPNFLLLAAALLFSEAAFAQVMITEVQPNPNGADEAEWIEIHNTGGTAVSIAGWRLNDFGTLTPTIYAFPAGATIAAGQVIIVARQGTAYTLMANSDLFAVTVPDYEIPLGTDDPSIPNLDIAVSGAAPLGLANGGDGVVLADTVGNPVSTAEYGSGTVEVPGNPAGAPASGQSIGRVAATGSSDVDFVVLAVPTPGVGYTPGTPTPPTISATTRSPAVLVSAGALSLSASMVDAQGIAQGTFYFANATSNAGAASGGYIAASPSSSGNVYSAAIPTPATAPTSFNQQYIRYFASATDTGGFTARQPMNATTDANNVSYYWENVLPPTGTTPLATARAQGVDEIPTWRGHSVRVEGVVLTSAEAFITGRTNFFIADRTSLDAIRIFDDVVIPQALQPGDLVQLTGKIDVYRGVRQIGRDERTNQPEPTTPDLAVTVIGSGMVPVRQLSIAQLLANGETYESQLVEVAGTQIMDGTTAWVNETNVLVGDGTGTIVLRVTEATNLPGQTAPSSAFTLRGIFTQFAPNGTGGYQIQPRGIADIVGGPPARDGGVIDSGPGRDGGPGRDAGPGRDGGPRPDSGPGRDAGPTTDRDAGAGTDRDAGTGAPRDAGATAAADGGVFVISQGERDPAGCGCNTAGSSPGWVSLLGVFALGFVLRLRRRS